jgi:formyl-CoA transferase
MESGVSLAVWEAGRWFATGEVPQRLGSAHQSQAPYQAVRTADGWATLGAITPKTWAGLCRALDLTDLLDDERLATSSSRHALREEVVARVEGATTQLPTEEVVRRLEAEGVPCAPIADFGQVFTDEHLAARDFFWDAPHPDVGPVRQLGSPMRFSRSVTQRGAAGPDLGTGTRGALLSVGYSEQEVDALLVSGAAGVRS